MEKQIVLTRKMLSAKYLKYNELYFDSELPDAVRFYYIDSNNPIAIAGEGTIALSKRVNWTETLLKDVMVHEMIHLLMYKRYGIKVGRHIGHGKEFQTIMDEMNNKFDLGMTLYLTKEVRKGYLKSKYRDMSKWALFKEWLFGN